MWTSDFSYWYVTMFRRTSLILKYSLSCYFFILVVNLLLFEWNKSNSNLFNAPAFLHAFNSFSYLPFFLFVSILIRIVSFSFFQTRTQWNLVEYYPLIHFSFSTSASCRYYYWEFNIDIYLFTILVIMHWNFFRCQQSILSVAVAMSWSSFCIFKHVKCIDMEMIHCEK
jgi:hypothetical protein